MSDMPVRAFALDSPDGRYHVEFTKDRLGGTAWNYDTWTGYKHHYTFTEPTIHDSGLEPQGISLFSGLNNHMFFVTHFQRYFMKFRESRGYIIFDFGEYTITGKIETYRIENFN